MRKPTRSQFPLAADDQRHGTRSGYQWWTCRCDRCVKAYHDHEYNEGTGRFTVVPFEGGEIRTGGSQGRWMRAWHVVDERGRTQAIYNGGKGKHPRRVAASHARRLNREDEQA